MKKLTTFSYNLKQLLLKKKKNGDLSELSENDINNISPIYQEVDGKLRYYIDEYITDKLNDDIQIEIEALWTLD